jgi:signal transduction histidine kinase
MSVNHYYVPSSDPSHLPAQSLAGELLNIAVAINQGTSAEQAVDLLFDSLGHLVPYQRIGLAMVIPGGKLKSVHVRSTEPIIWGIGAEALLAGSSLEPILRDRQIRIIDDLIAYFQEHPHSHTAPLMIAEGMRSSLTLPLVTPQGPIGILFFSSTRPYAYDQHHVEFLGAIAAGLGSALERAHLVADLRRANEELRSLDRLKTNFLSNLSHELRTPLTQVLGYADTLEDEVGTRLTVLEHQYLRDMIAGADRLQELLEQLFDMTALESGGFSIDRVPVDLLAIAKEVVRDFVQRHVRTSQPNLRIEQVFSGEPLPVEGDPPRLAQAILALLENAHKFSPEGGSITLRAGRDGGQAWLEVQDHGIGIPLSEQERIFDKFFQLEAGPNRSFGGAGLGLPLAKAIAEAHGGSVSVASVPGRGSTFRITLPLGEAAITGLAA